MWDDLDSCSAESPGHCDVFSPPYYASDKRWAHYCTQDGGHDGAHECACGHRWTDPDQ